MKSDVDILTKDSTTLKAVSLLSCDFFPIFFEFFKTNQLNFINYIF